MLREKEIQGYPGWLAVIVLLAVIVGSIRMFVASVSAEDGVAVVLCLLAFAFGVVSMFGLTVVNPNEAKIVQLFGVYKGSIKTQGLWWVNPLTTRRRLSRRVRNFETTKLKVNDHDGNPIEIAAVVVWRVIETAEAMFHVDDYEQFVHVQSESAVRNLATSYPYDAHQEGQMSLRISAGEINQKLREELQERLAKAGVEVIEARLSHLAYAAEIASAMLRRQQASAIIAARQKIVEGAVGMVEMALDLLNAKQVVKLCSDRDAQPVVNTGTLYQ
jgi:regulator of protease activity HflC (stomatin/prohibitin superfamily)